MFSKYLRKTEVYAPELQSIGKITAFVRRSLTERRIEPKEITKAELVTEEAAGSLLTHGAEEGELRVSVRRVLGDVIIELSAPGEEYALTREMETGLPLEGGEMGREAQEALRGILLSSMTKRLNYRHKNGINYIRMTVFRSRRIFLYQALLALFSAVIFGLVLPAAAGSEFCGALDSWILVPLKTVYMNALRMVVAPVVFFSIVSSIAGFSNLSELGKIGGRTVALYVLTTVIAVCVGIGSFCLFRPGGTALMVPAASGAGAAAAQVSAKDLLVGIVPSDIIHPFLNNDMPQLIFMAALTGIATGMIGSYSAVLQSLFEACNELFMKMAGIIIRLMPLAIFCSVSSMILTMGIGTILSLVGMFGTFLFGLCCMAAVYCGLILVLGRMSPFTFLRKYLPTMLQVFSIASSNAAIPLNMEFCKKKLGVPGKVYNLTIPLGATLNMDGMCIQMAVFSLALANGCGVDVPRGALVALAFTIIMLSMGAPGMPGAGVICLSVLLEQLHVPTEAVSLVMGIGPILGMFLCMSNCLGDMVVTAIVARQAGLLDMDIYQS